MKNRYSVHSDTVLDEQNHPHTVYGLNILGAEPIPDIFTDQAEAEKLSSLCNRLDLSPIHIWEVIEDIL